MPKLAILTLGGLRISSADGRPVSIPTRKAQALLVYLAFYAGLPQPRAKIAALLWEDSGEVQARASLRQSLATLRQVLDFGPDQLSASTDSIVLSAGSVHMDAIEFDRLVIDGSEADLERAVALYSSDFLDSFDPRAPGFQEWTLTERYRLRERALQAIDRLLDHYMKSSLTDHAIALAIRSLALDPLQETVHCALMQLYARQGRAESALRQFQICREMLERELGVAPDAATENLYREIRARRMARSAVATAPAGSDGTRKSGIRDTPSDGDSLRIG